MESNCLVQDVDREIEALFAHIDRNKDGFISEKELKDMMKGLGEKVKKKDIKKMMKVADSNKDGKISFNGECINCFFMVVNGLENNGEILWSWKT